MPPEKCENSVCLNKYCIIINIKSANKWNDSMSISTTLSGLDRLINEKELQSQIKGNIVTYATALQLINI